jgi:4-amino-4-deoxy-L-arabinose transferase-like glycosyltransferase
VNPAFEAPDENAHFYLARHLADGGALPVQPLEPDERGLWEQEGSQPPLYYYLAAGAMNLPGVARRADAPWYNHQSSMGSPAIVGNENRFVHGYGEGRLIASDLWMARLLSTILGAFTVVGVWVIAAAALPGRPLLWAAAAALAALNPQFLYQAGSASNDGLVVTLATLALAAVTRVSDDRAGRWTLVVLALSAGLAPLAKLSGLAVLGFASASVAVLAIQRRSVRLLATAVLPGLVVAALAAGWWYARNLTLYGDLTGLSRMLPGDTRRDFVWEKWLAGLGGELTGLWRSFWGLFGWFTLPLPDWVYLAIDALVILALAGVLLALVRRADFVRWGVVAWLAAWAGVVFVSLLRWMMLAKGGHGRLLFPALAAVAVILVLGLRAIAPKRVTDGALALGVSAAMAALGVFSLVAVVRPAYARPDPIAALPASAVPTDALFGPPDHELSRGLVLRGVDLPARVGMGHEDEPITLYWQLDASSDGAPQPAPGGPWDGFVALRLDVPPPPGPWSRDDTSVDSPAEVVSALSDLAYLGGGALPPALMTPGEIYADARTMPGRAGADSPDGEGERQDPYQPYLQRLSLTLFHPDRGRWELVSGDVGPAGGEDEWATWLVRQPDQPMTAPGRDPDGAFEEGAPVHVWADVAQAPNGPVLNLTWRRDDAVGASGARQPAPGVELSAFVHFLDSTGTNIGQADGPPSTAAHFPTWAWRPGDVIASGPVPVPEGAVSALVGLYDPVSGHRVPVRDAGGNEADALVIPLTGPPR